MLWKKLSFLIITNLYEGLFSGGLIIVISELSAELSYPVGESISLGLVNAIQYLLRFVIRFLVDIIAFKKDDPYRSENPSLPSGVNITLMILFLIFTMMAYFLLIKSPFVLRRSMTDACQEFTSDNPE
jgi:hypothetical protein